jgi:acetyl esterase
MALDRPLYEMSLAEARQADLDSIVAGRGPATPVGSVTDLRIPGGDGEVPARLYHPGGSGTFPVVLYYFGGGWVLGTLDTCDEVCRRLCRGAGALVLSIGYRLAPEHPFPAAVRDCFAAAGWASAHVDGHGGDPARIAVAGDSAGGNLAAAVTLQARERGPALSSQVLVYPNTDYHADTASMRDNTDPARFNDQSVRWYWGHYLSTPADGADPLASPLRAPDLAGLPPALLITAEYDPLRDEGERYGQRLAQAGVPVTHRRYAGMAHGFFTMTGTVPQAREATEQVVEFLKSTLY